MHYKYRDNAISRPDREISAIGRSKFVGGSRAFATAAPVLPSLSLPFTLLPRGDSRLEFVIYEAGI